jgi:hypothetical protein
MTRALRRTAAVVTFVIAAYFAGSAMWMLSGWADVDLSRGGKVQVGLAFAAAAATLGWIGRLLWPPKVGA